MRKLISIALWLASLTLATTAFAKGDGVGLRMEGTVSNLEVQGEKLKFVLTGHFYFKQWRDHKESSVDVDGSKGIQVTVVQWKPFYAMTENGRGAAIRAKGALA